MLSKNTKKLFIFTTILSACCLGWTAGKLYLVSQKSNTDKLNIAFDLDDTLIISKRKTKADKSNLSNKENFYVSTDEKYYIWVRPYTVPVLHCLSYFTNMYLFTKASEDYANDICKITGIDKYFKKKLYKNMCNNEGKNLEKIGCDIKKTILVDNLYTNRFNNQNFYHIPEYEASNKNDIEMIKLLFHVIKKIF